MELLTIAEIQIIPIKAQNGLVGFASCSVNNMFFVGNLAIYSAPNHSLGYRVVYSTKKLKTGQQVPCFYPFKKEAEEMLTSSIVNKYLELMDNFSHVTGGNHVEI